MEHLVSRYCLLFIIFIFNLSLVPVVKSGDAEALLALKSFIDPFNTLQWQGSSVCSWQGVKECMDGRVTKLVLEYLNLTGSLNGSSLNLLDQIRVLSFKGNSISGQIPDLSGLVNLKSLYLNNNNFTGKFPDSLSDNNFNGSIPPLNQTSLKFFNVSNNHLNGQIPVTPALVRFNISSFSGNVGLCGEQVGNPCRGTSSGPATSPALVIPSSNHKLNKRTKLIIIVAASVAGGVVKDAKSKGVVTMEETEEGEASGGHGGSGDQSGKQGGFWESEGLGSLVFLGAGDQQMSFSLEDLLKASAETLGRGSMGSTYKAVMESGFIVTVKRLKDARYPRSEEFKRHMELTGRLRHPNLVPLRAYFQAKEERLLVYDYFPNGSLFSLIHGTKTSGGGKPLHWTSCLKIAEDLATGLLYIHQNPGLTHGNLKSSNVLLGPDFESCLTDYCLTFLRDPDSLEEPGATTFFYKAPECRDIQKSSTQPADVYSFGVLLLELLTGKTPFQDLVQEHGSDIPQWVRSVREEETESGANLPQETKQPRGSFKLF
ncbi:Inactive leucine-rich repeat receptor-like serine/threonine-protein kinase [Hibiscus syriacus]|uniref:Inactive leucine-rich repeat receptor-like serine/threonine-protein kinase n=1 Tax=Hibiscus syriacus TaxID=106335 RepID=A0A6A2WU71_HIBSY|nr:Inactive leucine-rich repeat receptor-like serine/threonine-protein kinase [Hibiscus syriacus]